MAGKLGRIGDELIEPDELCHREVYGSMEFIRWRDDDLPYLDGSNRSDLSPDEEVDDFLRRYQLGKPLTDIARLSPTADGVWEVRLQQLRLFGWFANVDVLVLANGEDVDLIKAGAPSYRDMIQSTKAQRKQLGLSYVAGHQTKVITSAKG